jgi:hypothetical protein
MIPVRLPYKPMPVANKTVVPFILLFNRAQDPAREYSTVLDFKDASGGNAEKRTVIPAPKLVHGRATTRLTFDFSAAQPGSTGLEDAEGLHVLLRIDAKLKSQTGKGDWTPISNACRVPVSPPEEK